MEYSGFWVLLEGVKPINKNRSNKNMLRMTSYKLVRKFTGLVNYYCDMWARHSYMLAHLTKSTSGKVKYKWTEVEQKAFKEIKRIVAPNILLAFPYFDKVFKILTDASEFQLLVVISQEGKHVAFIVEN